MTNVAVVDEAVQSLLRDWLSGKLRIADIDNPALMRKAGHLVRKAAALLDEVGWRQNNFGSMENRMTGPMCMVGAIRCVENRDPYVRSPQTDFTEYAFLHWSMESGANADRLALTMWNDRPNRTKRQVQKLMREFADAMDPQ